MTGPSLLEAAVALVLPDPLRVMISSRNSGVIGKSRDDLGDLRKRLAGELAGSLFGIEPLFHIYLSEYDQSAAAEAILTRCREKVRLADVVLVLYDGRAGWSAADTTGICQIEFNSAIAANFRKVRVIELPLAPLSRNKGQRERDEAFRTQKERIRPWALRASTAEEAVILAKQALFSAVIELAHLGTRSGRGRQLGDTGDALGWRRMNYEERAASMVSAMRVALQRAQATEPPRVKELPVDSDRMLVLPIAGTSVLVELHAIPAAMSVPAAREMVGQPFLDDYLAAPLLVNDLAGPLHLIACARGVTESQAVRQLGYPDATIVPSDFGIYVADPVQKQQLVFLSHCGDETSTGERIEMFLDWLARTTEDAALEVRARARSKLVRLIAEQL